MGKLFSPTRTHGQGSKDARGRQRPVTSQVEISLLCIKPFVLIRSGSAGKIITTMQREAKGQNRLLRPENEKREYSVGPWTSTDHVNTWPLDGNSPSVPSGTKGNSNWISWGIKWIWNCNKTACISAHSRTRTKTSISTSTSTHHQCQRRRTSEGWPNIKSKAASGNSSQAG